MKIKLDIDCSPEEAREFLGWPDVRGFQRAMLEQAQGRAAEYIDSLDPEKLAKMWLPAGLEAWDAMQKTFERFAAGGAGGGGDKPRQD